MSRRIFSRHFLHNHHHFFIFFVVTIYMLSCFSAASVAAADTYSSRSNQTDQNNQTDQSESVSDSVSDSVTSTTFADTVDLDRLRTEGGRYICRYEEHYYDGVGESVLTIEAVSGAGNSEGSREGYRAEWKGISDISEIITDKHMQTQQLIYTNPETDTELHVKRSGSRLVVSGFDAGEAVDEELELGSNRWFQLLPFSLITVTTAFSGSSAFSDSSSFSGSSAESDASEESGKLEEVDFSMFDPFNIKIRDLRVINQGKETITVKGVEYDAMKLNIRLQGFMSLFWKSEVWNDAASGTYIKYEGLNVVPEWYKSQIFLKSIEYQR